LTPYANREDTMKIASIAALAALLAAAVAFAGVGRPAPAHGSSSSGGRTITVGGTGEARAVPDTASFSFGVETEGPTAQAALAANAAKMRTVIAALTRVGVAKADLRTQDVSVSPHYTQSGQRDGFSATNSLEATVRELAKAGAAVDAAVAAGANQTSGPQFDRTDREALTEQALRDAFANARAKAQALAQQAGAQLGEVQRIDETSAYQPQPVYDMAMSLQRAAKTPVEAGTQQVQASVRVTFTLG
jgi:uncharacterized protein YggE